MNLGKTVFSQLMSLLPDYEFNKCVARYNGDYRIKEFSGKEHFLVMSFAQLTYRDSLRDIESCLQAMSKKLYHSGIKKPDCHYYHKYWIWLYRTDQIYNRF